ncbi:MAG: SAM-dependent methyltransferase [Myxococcota bacterium]
MARTVWGFMTRADSIADLLDEIPEGETVSEGVVRCTNRPRARNGQLVEPTFARQAIFKPAQVHPEDGEIVEATLARLATQSQDPWALQVVAPDGTDPEDPRRPLAAEWEAKLAEGAWLSGIEPGPSVPADEAKRLLQVWVLSEDALWVGVTPKTKALSPWPGGRSPLRRGKDAVSRAGLKLEEAIAWTGVGPEKGDLVADLGAAPGGWTQVLLARGCTVIAVDPKGLVVKAPPQRLAHLQQSAFAYAPPETLDWVVCDMAYRPLEVAKLLAKWARRSWARQVIANVKLPMRRKVGTLAEVSKILESAGWEGLKTRQLFHDRDEITLYAHLSAKQAVRPAQPPHRKSVGPRNQPRRGKPRRGGPRKRPRKTSIKRRN